jgi:hypothetical protein
MSSKSNDATKSSSTLLPEHSVDRTSPPALDAGGPRRNAWKYPRTSIPKHPPDPRNDGLSETALGCERQRAGRESVLFIWVMPSCIKIRSVVLYHRLSRRRISFSPASAGGCRVGDAPAERLSTDASPRPSRSSTGSAGCRARARPSRSGTTSGTWKRTTRPRAGRQHAGAA